MNRYRIREENGKQAIFDDKGNQISEWFDWVWEYGLVKGQSDYYIAVKNKKYAIFDKSSKRISEWFDDLLVTGLVKGQSDYYIAGKDEKWAIFHKSGKQISDWFDGIVVSGLVSGQNDFYIAKKNNKWAIYHKDGLKLFEVKEKDVYDKAKRKELFKKAEEFFLEQEAPKPQKVKRNIVLDDIDVNISTAQPKRNRRIKP